MKKQEKAKKQNVLSKTVNDTLTDWLTDCYSEWVILCLLLLASTVYMQCVASYFLFYTAVGNFPSFYWKYMPVCVRVFMPFPSLPHLAWITCVKTSSSLLAFFVFLSFCFCACCPPSDRCLVTQVAKTTKQDLLNAFMLPIILLFSVFHFFQSSNNFGKSFKISVFLFLFYLPVTTCWLEEVPKWVLSVANSKEQQLNLLRS